VRRIGPRQPREGSRRYASLAYSHAPTDSRVRRHCEALARRGWQVYQLGLAAAGEARVARLNGVVLLRWARPRYRGAQLWRYALAYAGFWCWARAVLHRLRSRGRVDVVHVNNLPNFMVWAAGPARRGGAGVILDIHDPVPELLLSKFGHRPGARAGARLLVWEERLATRAADAVLCVHEPHRALTVAHGVDARKIRVMENLADERLFPLEAPRPATPFVAYHGTVAARMGLDALLEALHLLDEAGVPVRAAIWGEGDAVDSLRRLRDRLGLSTDVEISGERFTAEQLLPRLRRVGIGVVPLRRDVFTDLILPVKVLEYVRLGIPVVATWTPTLAYYFPTDELTYVRESSPAALAAAVREVLASPEQARARAGRAQALPIARAWQEREPDFVRCVEEVAAWR
jgi:glycosyltransferase involved in cell wall biosynthesis